MTVETSLYPFVRYYKGHYTRKNVNLKTFKTQIEIIYGILAKNDYIECIATDNEANKLVEYIRRENTEIKSETGKRLLTLATDLVSHRQN